MKQKQPIDGRLVIIAQKRDPACQREGSDVTAFAHLTNLGRAIPRRQRPRIGHDDAVLCDVGADRGAIELRSVVGSGADADGEQNRDREQQDDEAAPALRAVG